jgi:hypothetical protein
MYGYTFVCMNTCLWMGALMYVWMNVPICSVCVCVYGECLEGTKMRVSSCLCLLVHVFMYAYVRACVCVCVCVCVCESIHTCSSIHKHHKRRYTHACSQRNSM